MVLLSAQGMNVAQIATVAFTSPDRGREVLHNFNDDGFDSLVPKYSGGRPPIEQEGAHLIEPAGEGGQGDEQGSVHLGLHGRADEHPERQVADGDGQGPGDGSGCSSVIPAQAARATRPPAAARTARTKEAPRRPTTTAAVRCPAAARRLSA